MSGAAVLCGVAVCLAGLVYAGALGNPFVYDDHLRIVDNPWIRDLRNVRVVVLSHVFRPLVNLTYALDHAVWGLWPVGFHLTSLALHMANVALLFAWARALVEDRARVGPAGSARPGGAHGVAFTAAALFAVHPMMTEAVGYVSARPEVLCATLFLLALLAVRRGLRDGATRWTLAGLALAFLALLAKEVAVMFPFVLLAWDRVVLAGRGESPEARRRRLWRLHLPLAGAAAMVAAGRVVVFLVVETQPPPVAWWQYLLMQAGVVWRYLWLFVAPSGQSLVHSVRVVTTPADAAALLAAAALIGLGAAAFRLRVRLPLVAFGATWFLLLLMPSSSVVPLGEAMAEHRVYLASAGLFLAVAAGVGALAREAVARRLLPSFAVPRVVLGLVLALLGLATAARTLVWADPVTLWRDAARKAPDTWLPHYALGEALRERGDCPASVPAYREAVRLRPEEPRVYPNLGVCLMETGRLEEAARVFASALRVDPTSARVHNNLGVLALRSGDPAEARRRFLEALRLEARHVPARQNLAALYEGSYGDPAEALRLCREARELAPGTAGVEECIRRNERRLAGRPATP